ncbi:aAA domain (Dynein-related subfamily) [Clostridium sp. CAG:138]|jgi:hypothetical protein|nr:aAA domain (Dynein-related subfamily) [Clostridium sp. CAG:138]
MNIKEAKEQIKNAMTAYFTKDGFGGYAIPIEKQRPVFLMGPPGIGKTAIMEQIASELGVGLISYSMTHHTRQSALGLPFIVQKNYGGREYDVSEYTMSEIIASVYDMMEETGLREGILFLDEINCVSETLAPSMLQFLQYKIFGRHRVPDGWIVVTAGNPPEYNNSVREFDIVTWDRLKRIDVEPDFGVWKEYAYLSNVHPAIISYLDVKHSDFYKIESTVDGKSFVTARGWSDLSDMIKLYEKHGLKVDNALVSQYLQNKKIARDFAVYYDLYMKYKSDYQIGEILSGKASEEIKRRAKAAKFDERLALLSLILDGVNEGMRAVANEEDMLSALLACLKEVRAGLSNSAADAVKLLGEKASAVRAKIEKGKASSSLSAEKRHTLNLTAAALEEEAALIERNDRPSGTAAFALMKKDFDSRVAALKKNAEAAGKKLSNAFAFLEEVFGEGQELLILVTELTINAHSSRFISRYGCKEYFAHNKELLFYERRKELIEELGDLNFD